ncbi:MAG TPA: NADH-quinone oxidoreductase subunit M [Candidatus Solibacter sp.]|nr:NADH-quinone oxidoreductase subunit M [Candidatus Solibacter sp.]
MTLLILLFLPLVAALAIPRLPVRYLQTVGLLATGIDLLVSLVVLQGAANGAPLSLDYSWAAGAGLNFRLSADGVSSALLALNALVGLMAVLATRVADIKRPHLFMALLLSTQTAIAGALLAQDLVLFFVFYEAVLVPFFILIAVFGEGDRQRSALKLLIFTSAGSLAMLLSILTVYAAGGGGFALGRLTGVHLVGGSLLFGLTAADIAFAGFALAFAIKTPIFPFHGWLADVYTSAPTPVVMILAGMVSKLGPYGFFRVALPLLPDGARDFSPLLMALAAVGIVYGALLALRQQDAKRMVAYLSLSHMCFITLGILSLTPAGISGGVLQMLNHGILITSLFFIVGHFERRLGTRDRANLGGLSSRAPLLTAVFLVLALATLGMPGLNGFVGEYLILLGAYARSWALLLVAAAGVVLAAWYTLRLYQGAMNGPAREADGAAEIGAVESGVLLPLAVLAVAIGVYPAPFLALINDAVGSLVKLMAAG